MKNKKNNLFCPLCGSDKLIAHTQMQVEDPVSKVFVTRKRVKTCSECGMTTYLHATRGWEGCVFNCISGFAEYYMNNAELLDGRAEYLKLQKRLPKIAKNLSNQSRKTPLVLPRFNSREYKPVGTDDNTKKENIYYYKSSLGGITVLS